MLGSEGEEVAHHLLASGLVPFACIPSHDLDIRVLGQHLGHAGHAGFVGRVADKAFDEDDIALTAQLLGQPAGADHRPFFLVDDHIVDASAAIS